MDNEGLKLKAAARRWTEAGCHFEAAQTWLLYAVYAETRLRETEPKTHGHRGWHLETQEAWASVSVEADLQAQAVFRGQAERKDAA